MISIIIGLDTFFDHHRSQLEIRFIRNTSCFETFSIVENCLHVCIIFFPQIVLSVLMLLATKVFPDRAYRQQIPITGRGFNCAFTSQRISDFIRPVYQRESKDCHRYILHFSLSLFFPPPNPLILAKTGAIFVLSLGSHVICFDNHLTDTEDLMHNGTVIPEGYKKMG